VEDKVPSSNVCASAAQLKRLRATAVALLSSLLLAASSSSESLFVLTFQSNADSAKLIDAAKIELRKRGFVSEGRVRMRYGVLSESVEVISQKPGVLELYFVTVRGGCSNEPGVAYAKPLVTAIAASMAAEFGPSEVAETKAANLRPHLRSPTAADPGTPDNSLKRAREHRGDAP
jgi:hypothetical protein